MNQTKGCRIERFAGLSIKLWFKDGKTVQLGDGLFISDGVNAHTWIGKRTGDGKSILVSTNHVREDEIKNLRKATYRNIISGNFETLKF